MAYVKMREKSEFNRAHFNVVFYYFAGKYIADVWGLMWTFIVATCILVMVI